MSAVYGSAGPLKKFAIFALIATMGMPIHYGSTDPIYILFRLSHSTLSMTYSFVPDPTRPTVSADYRALEFILRVNPILNVDISGDPLTIVKNMRYVTNMNNITPKPSQCQITKEVFEHDGHTVDTYWIDYSEKNFQRHSDRILFYFHGGGYMLGDVHGYSGYECHLSRLFNVTILHLEYRLCPEHPLPAAVEDGVAVYRSLLRSNISPSQLLFMGDSAGGGLSLLTMQAIIAHQLPVPHGIIALSPWSDLTGSGESYTRNRHIDVILRSYDNAWAIARLLGPNHAELAPDSPVYSPMFGSFKGFPQMYITVGTAEVLEDDSRAVVKKAQDAGVDVTFEIGLHMMHTYPIFYLYFPEARNTLGNINQWIRSI